MGRQGSAKCAGNRDRWSRAGMGGRMVRGRRRASQPRMRVGGADADRRRSRSPAGAASCPRPYEAAGPLPSPHVVEGRGAMGDRQQIEIAANAVPCRCTACARLEVGAPGRAAVDRGPRSRHPGRRPTRRSTGRPPERSAPRVRGSADEPERSGALAAIHGGLVLPSAPGESAGGPPRIRSWRAPGLGHGCAPQGARRTASLSGALGADSNGPPRSSDRSAGQARDTRSHWNELDEPETRPLRPDTNRIVFSSELLSSISRKPEILRSGSSGLSP